MAKDNGLLDLLDWVGPDISAAIFARVDHPADLVRASAVGRSWRRYVVESGFCKTLCLRLCPEAATIGALIEVPRSSTPPSPSASPEAAARAAEFRIYAYLCGALLAAKPAPVDCILHCVGASSTDNFPEETMEHTLEPGERVNNHRFSYWSSGGQVHEDVPESLTYRLSSDVCIVHEIRIQPFKARFQNGHPIYSSRMVRFRMGHCKLPRGSESFVTDEDENEAAIADENYVWTYTSPEFPMLQEDSLQTFKLPRPALCIGGIVKIELLGRVQKQATDNMYYICVCHAQVVGRSLSPVLMLDITDSGSRSVLKYLPAARDLCTEALMQQDNNAQDSLEWSALLARHREMRHLAIMHVLLGGPARSNEEAGGVLDPFAFVDGMP